MIVTETRHRLQIQIDQCTMLGVGSYMVVCHVDQHSLEERGTSSASCHIYTDTDTESALVSLSGDGWCDKQSPNSSRQVLDFILCLLTFFLSLII